MTKACGEGVLQVTLNTLQKWANELPKMFTDKKGVVQRVWCIPPPYCAMCYLNHPRDTFQGTVRRTLKNSNTQD